MISRNPGERHEICPVKEIPPGGRKLVEVDGLSIGIFNLDGEFHALLNICPHQGAPLCKGEVTGMATSSEVGEYEWERDGQIVRCPWHHWEFDITTGESVFNPHRVRTKTYDVRIEAKSETVEENGMTRQEDRYGTTLEGDEPPVDIFSVNVEDELVVLYV